MYLFYIKPYTDQYFTYYYMMSANWVSVKIMVPSECRPTGFLPTARPPLSQIFYSRQSRTITPERSATTTKGVQPLSPDRSVPL